MFSRRHKIVYFFLEGLNAYAASFYFNYLFFHLRDQFGFGNTANLATCALHGFVFMCSAWFGGRFSQRAGYLVALPLGFGIMGGTLLLGLVLSSLVAQFLVLALWTFGMCFTWPTLEALASERETSVSLRRMIGIYNVTWAAGSALACFTGGALLEWLGPRSLFWFPALLHGIQLVIVLAVKRGLRAAPADEPIALAKDGEHHEMQARPGKVPPKAFLRMAWLANPFAYVAMNALIPVIPRLAKELHFATDQAGFFCSIWLFARLAAFILLWQWAGWHYRFRWLFGSFVVMIACFAAILLALNLAVIIAAQVGFGLAVGLIYFSSLFYSMDVGETKGEHGGIHEAAIGSGVFGGAGLGALGQLVFSGPTSSTWVVSMVLVAGLAGLWLIRQRSLPRTSR